jgi:phosphoglycolate phosphatase
LYKLAIFDFDGTLVDSAPGIVDVMRDVVEEYLLSKEIFEKWRQLVGVPLLQQAQIILPEKDAKFHLELINRYRTIYDTKVIEICPLFPGLITMLDQLVTNNVELAIVSSKRRSLVEVVLDHHNLARYFRLVVGQQDVGNHKPHPEGVHLTVDSFGIRHKDVVVIGDSSFDLDMARAAGVDSIGVTTGIHTREILARSGPIEIVESLDDVTPLILNGYRPVFKAAS